MNKIIKFREFLKVITAQNQQPFVKMTKSSGANDEIVTEDLLTNILEKKFPGATSIIVEDTSQGCGAMFNIFIEADEFKHLSIPKQHKAIYEALDAQIKKIHGVHISTKVPK